MPPEERVTPTPAPGHPPCPQVCWVEVDVMGPGGVQRSFLARGSVNAMCRWDREAKRWNRCDKETP